MPCYSPLSGWLSRAVNPKTGRRSVTFTASEGFLDRPMQVPCGQCIGCRLERSRQWAVRCVHEASLHEENSFITLTYRDDDLPSDGGLHLDQFQKFMKRLRFHISPKKLRFFHCGEYGEKNLRPHYHAILFGFDFPDKELFKTTPAGPLYTSHLLSELWPFGFSTVGAVTFDSAAYVARYVMKKVNGDLAEEHYSRVDPDTGEVFQVSPEYTTMSRRPGIAAGWYEKYSTDVYPSDFLTLNGVKFRPPKFYDRLFQIDDPDKFEKIRDRRLLKRLEGAKNNTPERLHVRETVQKSKLTKLKRPIEE